MRSSLNARSLNAMLTVFRVKMIFWGCFVLITVISLPERICFTWHWVRFTSLRARGGWVILVPAHLCRILVRLYNSLNTNTIQHAAFSSCKVTTKGAQRSRRQVRMSNDDAAVDDRRCVFCTWRSTFSCCWCYYEYARARECAVIVSLFIWRNVHECCRWKKVFGSRLVRMLDAYSYVYVWQSVDILLLFFIGELL